MAAYDDLMAFQRDTEALSQVAGRLGWDQETMMPDGAAAGGSLLLFERLPGCEDAVVPLDMPGSIPSILSLLDTGGSRSTMYSLMIRPAGHIVSTMKFKKGSAIRLMLVM